MTGDQELWEKICSYQNMGQAWNKVKSNKGGPGVDRETIGEFDQNLDENLKTLCDQLQNGDYAPLPVQRVYIGKDDGTRRCIGISAIRDRVVQQSLHLVLSPIFDNVFSDCSFAYRPGRSCLGALGRIDALIKGGCTWVLDGDIDSFFDSIDHELLMGFVAERVSDTRILNLIRALINVGIFEDMSLRNEYLGISQGSVISPLLANLYLNCFDREIVAKGYHLIRYADDFIVLGKSQEMVAKALVDITDVLASLKLNLNEKKTRLIHAGKGFVFLGYYIDLKGRGPSKKAIAVISRRLHEMTETGKRRDIGERINELKQSISGWSVYFHTCQGIEPENALVLVALIETSLELGDEENAKELFKKQKDLSINQPDILYRMGHLAQKLGLRDEALNAYSHTLSVAPDHVMAKESLEKMELVDEDVYSSIVRLKKFIHHCPDMARPYHDLAFCYTELGEYGQAQESYQKALDLEMDADMDTEPVEKTVVAPPLPVESQQLVFSDADVSVFTSIFRGRKDVFACQWVDGKGRRGFTHISRPLDNNEIRRHLAGEQTLGLYLMDGEDRVNLSVIDVDINQKALLEYATDENELEKLHRLAEQDTARITSVCDDLQIPYLIEDSGYKGRHIWFFFETPVSAKLARTFLKFIIEKAGNPGSGIHRDIFPNIDKVKGEGAGPLIKLPLGIHKRTNRRCLFLANDGNPLPGPMAVLSGTRHISRGKIEEILLTRVVRSATGKSNDSMSPMIESLLSSCNVIGHLVKKAEDTHYLDNSERVTLLYTFGHLGQEGNEFLHKVISNCINYDYDFTEKKIMKIKPYPISCAKIKEKHEDIALNPGCNCHFKIPRGGYPSPVLHAFKIKYGPKKWIPQSPMANNDMMKINGGISGNTSANTSIYTSLNTSKNRNMNISAKLKTYIELKKHLDGINRSIHRTEEEMASFFDHAGTDSLLTEYGLLVRRKKAGDKIEWIIRL